MKIAATGFFAAALLAAMAAGAAAAPVTLKFSTTMPAVNPVIKNDVLPLLDKIGKDSGGTIAFESFTDGQLTPNPAKQFDAMANGIDDVTIILASYTPQIFPDASLFALPDLVRSSAESGYGGWKLYAAGLLRGMDRMKTLAIYSADPATVFTARKISSLDGLKGLKIRVSGPAQAQIISLLGAAPVGMSATDVAEELDRGVVDGTFNGWGVNRLFRATPLIKTAFPMSLGVDESFLAMNRAVYGKLPQAAKAAIDRDSGLALSVALGRANDDLILDDRAAARKNGVLLTLSAADAARLTAIYRPLIDKWAAATPAGAKKVAALDAAVAQYRRSERP